MRKNKESIGSQTDFSNQSGKSVLEMLLVMVIVVIVATFAVAQYSSSKTQFSRQNVARQLKISMERARFDSVKRRTSSQSLMAKVIVDQSWFSVTTDLNGNQILDSSETEATHFGSAGISIIGQSMVFPVTLYFDERGNVEARGSDNALVNPIFYVCNGTCTVATLTSANSNIVLVSPTGTVNLLAGNAAIPSFANPGVSTISSSTGINDFLVVTPTPLTSASPTPSTSPTASASPTASTSPTSSVSPSTSPSVSPSAVIVITTPSPSPTFTFSPSVSPTATPVATATPMATPTPTAAPTPVVTATPTPTPVNACTSGQKPAQTGCTCVSPMATRTNGKCT